jgi:hypothetical protein
MSSQTSAAPSVRVPKLAVRNRAGTESSTGGNTASQTSSSHSSTRTVSPRRDRGTSDASQRSKPSSVETGARRSESTQTKQPQPQQQPQQQQTKEKKKSGMLGFLTLKEPSTNALEQFAAEQKKAAALKTRSAKPVGLANVSQQKLPGHVPKVNSKWDGLPEDARKRLEHQRKKSHDAGASLFTTNTRQSQRSHDSSSSSSSNSTRRPIGSMSSRPSSMSSTVRAGHKFIVVQSSVPYDTTTPIAVHPDALGEPSPMDPAGRQGYFSHTVSPTTPPALSPTADRGAYFHDARSVRRFGGAVPVELAGRAIAELPGNGPVELPAEEPPQMAGDEPAYITTPSASPLTPPIEDLPEHVPRMMRSGMRMDAQGTMWYSDSDSEAHEGRASESEVLTTNFPAPFGKRRPLEYIAESPIETPDAAEDWPLPVCATRAGDTSDANDTPTPTETSITTAPAATTPPPAVPVPPVSSTALSRPLLAPTSRYSAHSASTRPPSIAPSVASSAASTIEWPLPPTARLAMGGGNTGPTPRKADVAPWERFDGRTTGLGAIADRSSAAARPSAGSSAAPKVKRFSGLLGRK